MLKQIKAFSLILCCFGYFWLEAKELDLEKGEEAEIKTQVFQNFDKISGQDMESFGSGIAAIERLRNSREDNIPESLIPLNEIFNELSHRVRTDPNPDNIDIILLLDANGKTQTLAIMYFLRELENALRNSANKDFPGTDLKLFSVIDSFVGEGGGAIPAAVCALGRMRVDEAIEIVRQIPSELLCPKSLYDCCGCCLGFRSFTKAAVSAYVEKPELIDEDNSKWISLYYNAFKPGRKYNEYFHRLYGASSISDLRSSFETVSLKRDSSSISRIVSETISTRDKEAKSNIKRLGITEFLSTAESLLTDISGVEGKISGDSEDDILSAARALGELKIILHNAMNGKYATVTNLRDHIIQKLELPRDTLIISVMSDTSNGSIIIPTFTYSIKVAPNGKKIINMNYKITIPRYFYTPSKNEIESYDESVWNSVKSVFPMDDADTNISKATEMFMGFLDNCNKRVLEDF